MSETDIATIGIAVDSSQVDASTASLNKWVEAGSKVDALLERIRKNSADAMRGMSPAMAAAVNAPSGGMYGPAWQQSLTASTTGYVGLAAAAEAAKNATLGQAAATKEAASAHSAHAIGVAAVGQALDGFTAATGRGTGATKGQTEALRNATAAHKSHGAAAYGNTLQMMELAHVGRALFDEMMAGGSIVRGLAMEFGRLQIAVTAGEGGITGMLGRVAGFAGRLANPLTLATGGVLALGAASTLAFLDEQKRQEELERALSLRGRYSGLTLEGANRLAASSAAAGGLSVREGTGLAASYLGAGLSKDVTASAIEASRDFGRVSGKGTEKGAEFLAGALADPVRGLGQFGELIGGIDDRLKQQIESLTRSGHVVEAQALELGFVNKAMREASESTFSFSRAMSGAGNWISDRFSALGHGVATALGYGSDEDKIAKDRALIVELQRSDPSGTANGPDIVALRQEIARLEAAIGKTSADAAKREADGRAGELSGRAGDALRALMPEIGRQRTAADTVELLRSALSTPGVFDHLAEGITPAMLGRGFAQASVLEAMSRPGLRERQDYDLGLSRIRDSGVQDQGLNAARRAELEILRTTGDVIRGATAAQRAYNLELASAQERADEMARSSKQRFDLIGLSPFDRAMKEVDQKYLGPRGLIESYSLDRGGANIMADKDIRGDLSGGMKILAAAQDTAGGITAAGGHVVAALDGVANRIGAAGSGPAPWASTLDRSAFGQGSGKTGQPMFAAMQSFVDRGYSPAAAAGFVAGLSMESGTSLDPRADNGSHLGIAQWDAARYGRLAGAFGPQIGTRQGQLGGVFLELGTNEAGAGRMLAGSNTALGGILASDAYERPGPEEAARRRPEALSRANALLSGYQGSGTPSTLTIAARDAAVAPIAYSGGQSVTNAYHSDQAGVLKSYTSADPDAFGTALGEANRRLKEQQVLTDLSAGSFGKVDLATRSALEGQKLWQSFVDSGATKTIRLSDATGGLADAVRAYGQSAAEAAAKADDLAKAQRGIAEASDFARGGLSSVLSGGLLSAAHGQGFGKGAKSALESFGESLLTKSISGGVNALTGGAGNPLGSGSGGGFLSALTSMLPHFATGTSDAPGGLSVINENGPELVNLPPHAQVMTADQTSGLMGNRGSGGHTFNMGDTIVQVQGDVSEGNRMEIQRAVAAGQQRTIDHITRNMPQIQSDARQY